jgi:type III pantothenate kinase
MPPLLLIDVGNTRIKWATATPRGALRARGQVATSKITSSWADALTGEYPTHRVIIASVVPSASAKIRSAFGGRVRLVTAESSGLKFEYPRPGEIGADRLACAAAMRGPAIIVACGTATAFSVVDARGRFCGGVIAPGLATQLAGLVGSGAQLPETALRFPSRLPGRSTRDAIRAGVVLNFQGGVREILLRLQKESKTKSRVVLTGGYARFLARAELGPVELRPLLVLEGLHIIGHRLFTDR